MIRNSKAVWEQVVDRVQHYPLGVGRSQIAEDFNIGKSTAQLHLDKAVSRGKLFRCYTWINHNHRGWVYYHPTSFPKAFSEVDALVLQESESDHITADQLAEAGYDDLPF